jgi:hypothetical protein
VRGHKVIPFDARRLQQHALFSKQRSLFAHHAI